MARLLVKSCVLLPMSPRSQPIPRGAAIVEDGVLQAVGPLEQMAPLGPFEREVGSEAGHIALPGFINAHHHPGRPSRLGITAGQFLEPLDVRQTRRIERPLPPVTAEDAYYHTLWYNILQIRGGVTAVIELHGKMGRSDEMQIPASVQAYVDSGMRALLCLGCSDRHRFVYEDDRGFVESLPPPLRARLAPTVEAFDEDGYFAQWSRLFKEHSGGAGRVFLGLGPAGPEWCSDNLLTRVRDTAREYQANVQIHLLETKYQFLFAQRCWGTTAVQHLVELGLLGPNLSCAHCVWVTHEDGRRLADSGATVAHNPSSNLLLASGIAPIMDLLEAGANVALGLDALDFNDVNDALTDLRLAWLLQRQPGIDTPRPSAVQMLSMATVAGARALPQGGTLGALEPGKRADIILLDRDRIFDSPYLSPSTPVEEVLLRRATGADVDTVIIDGRVVMEGHRLLTIDEASVQRQITASMERYLAAAQAGGDAVDELVSHVEDFYRRMETEAGAVPSRYQYNTR